MKQAMVQKGKFVGACLQRGNLIADTTVGNELENSNWELIPEGTVLLLAHNLAISQGSKGIQLMNSLHKNNVLALPGQVLTLGNAFTSRLACFWRKAMPFAEFVKLLAHRIVKDVVGFWVSQVVQRSKVEGIFPYQAMLHFLKEGKPNQQPQAPVI